MASDYALLFPPVHRSPQEVIPMVLPLLGPVGARYRGIVTRMDYSSSENFWRLSTHSKNAGTVDGIIALLDQWEGLALELESKFAPMKLMVWKEQGDGAGFGLFETSRVFTVQAEDPDICDIFDSVALDMARATNSDAFALVGDPGIATMTRDEVIVCVSRTPQPTSDPPVYSAGLKIETHSTADIRPASEWVVHRKNGFLIFRAPEFGKVPDDE
jgi:hypothetical protein